MTDTNATPGIIKRIDQFAEQYLGHVTVTHDTEYGEMVPADRVKAALREARNIGATLDGPTPIWDMAPFLNDDGDEVWAKLDGADRDRLERALVYAAGELAALQAEMNLTVLRAVSLFRLLGAEQPTRACRDTECGYIDPGVEHVDH